MSPGEVLAKHNSQELSEWAAFFMVETMDAQQAKDKAELQTELRARKGRGR